MNRKLSLAGVHRVGSHHGKLFSPHAVRKTIWIAAIAAAVVLLSIDWLDNPTSSSSSSSELIQQLVWNPSPK